MGIDSSDPQTSALTNRRIASVRDALLEADMPSSSIQTGDVGNPQQRRDRRVEVLVGSQSPELVFDFDLQPVAVGLYRALPLLLLPDLDGALWGSSC